jgi:hypothetical protein
MQRARIMLGFSTLPVGGCGDGTGPSSAQGVWQFLATYGGNGCSCSIGEATLTFQREAVRWTGSLTGGAFLCVPPPGNPPPVPQPGGTVALDSISVQGSAVSFRLSDEPFIATGQVTDGEMSGTVQAPKPFCQCTEPYMSGTWTAIRMDVASAAGRP